MSGVLDPAVVQTVVETLVVQTSEGKLKWSRIDDDFGFRAEAGESEFEIRSRDGDDYAPFDFWMGRGGIDVAEAATIIGPDGSITNSPINGLLRSLYRSAKRRALGLDAAIDGILNDLENL